MSKRLACLLHHLKQKTRKPHLLVVAEVEPEAAAPRNQCTHTASDAVEAGDTLKQTAAASKSQSLVQQVGEAMEMIAAKTQPSKLRVPRKRPMSRHQSRRNPLGTVP